MPELTPSRVLRYGFAVVGILLFVGLFLFWLSPNARLWDAYLALLLLILLSSLVLVYRKLVINFIDSRKEVRHAAAQQQALHYLFQRINPNRTLPKMRSYAASPDFLCLLYDLIREHKPGLVLECGAGVSTLISAYALQQNGKGRVVALEHDSYYADLSRRTLREHGLAEVAEVLHAPLKSYSVEGEEIPWYDLSSLPTDVEIDLLVVDGPPSTFHVRARYPAYPLLKDWLSSRAVILVDDGIRPAEREMVERWAQARPDFQLHWVPTEKRAAVLRSFDG